MTSFPVSFLVPGSAKAALACLQRPLSFWGGYDPAQGVIIDETHPDLGRRLAGCIVAMREVRGSSSSSSTLVESVRHGLAPAAILLERIDPILTIGSLVASDLYRVTIPIALLEGRYWPMLANARTAELDARQGVVRV